MTISNEAIEAAALAVARVETGDDGVTFANDIDRIHARAALEAAAPIIRGESDTEALPIIRDLIDADPCSFDHHGGCQAHGYLSLQPGEKCPQHDAKAWLRARAAAERGGQ